MATGWPMKTTYADGDVYSAADVNDITGTINLLGSSVAYAAGKNKIINGDFGVNQRGFSSTTTDGTFGFDRFRLDTSGGTTMSAQVFTPGTAPVAGYESANYLRSVTTGQTGTSAYTVIRTTIEDVRTFAGQTVTLSFWAKAATGTPKIATDFRQLFGSGGSPSTTVNTYSGQATLSTSWARYSLTVAIPSISGKTIGTTANTSALVVQLWTSAGTDFNSRTGSLGIQSATIDIWGVQLESGSTATAFQTATGTIQGELAACQRYLPAIPVATGDFAFGQAFSSTKALVTIPYFVQPRVAPTGVTVSAVASFALRTPAAGFTFATAIVFNNATLTAANLEVTAGASFTAGQASTFYNSAGSLLFTGCEL
jgi:hypothetical protein